MKYRTEAMELGEMSAKEKKKRVLVVDDDIANIEMLTSILEDTYEICSAFNGVDALEFVRTHDNPDIILLDVVMPKMDGYAVCTELKSDPETSGIPIIFISALHSPGDEARGLRLGAMDYLSKPLAPAIVHLRIKTQLELKAHREQLEQLVASKASQLKKAYDELKELDRLKSALLDSVSHELRTPLTSVIGFAKVSAKKLSASVIDKLDNDQNIKVNKTVSQVMDNLHRIVLEAEHLSLQVQNVMEFSELMADNLKITTTPIEVAPLMQRVISFAKKILDERKMRLEYVIEPDLPQILGNQQRLEQVLENLLSNAIKFNAVEGVVHLSARRSGQELVITIQDFGSGISVDEQKIIFNHFEQLSDSLTGKPKGLGIGLSLSQLIMERMQGRIWVDSEAGKGSSFSIAMPVCPAE